MQIDKHALQAFVYLCENNTHPADSFIERGFKNEKRIFNLILY